MSASEIMIVQATGSLTERYAEQFIELMYATGPSTYTYQFGERTLFDRMVAASWPTAGTLFGWDGTRLALDGDELVGIEVGFPGSEFVTRKKALAPLWSPLLEAGTVSRETLAGIARRTYLCSYLNVAIPNRVHYIHALAVHESLRGRGIGARLLANAMESARIAGLRGLHLDVLSDNPAVDFYRAHGLSCLAETTAPEPARHGVPMEMRMALDFAA